MKILERKEMKLMLPCQRDNRPTFVMLVGLPGSGKSTLIEKEYSNFCVHSSDAIREELSGDVNNQDINKQVFDTLHKRVKADLSIGKNVVYDATNISWKRRKAFLQELSSIPCWKDCVLMATPFEVCVQRNNDRDRKVPYFVIERMYKNFDIPWYNEGWDSIEIAYTNAQATNYYGDWSHFITGHLNYLQESKWHTETLGDHCLKTLQYVQSQEIELNDINRCETMIAAALHDCGKPFCKTFKDSRGEITEFAHYYSHENVGAYKSLFYGKEDGVDSLLVAALIRWHMVLHFFKDWKQKTIEKYENEFTCTNWLNEQEFYKALKILHEGDKNAH
jgi:predicted kinase